MTKKALLRNFSLATVLFAGSFVNSSKAQPPIDYSYSIPPLAPVQTCDPCFASQNFYYQPVHRCRPLRDLLGGIAGFFHELANLGSCHRGNYGYGGWAQPYYFAQPEGSYGFQRPSCCGGLEGEVIYENGTETILTPQPTPVQEPQDTQTIPKTPVKKQTSDPQNSPTPGINLQSPSNKVAQVNYLKRPEPNHTGSGIVVSEASASGHSSYRVVEKRYVKVNPAAADNEWHAVREEVK